MKAMKHILLAICLTLTAAATAQTVRFYKFCDVTKGHREPYATTRTLKTYPIGTLYREGQTEPRLTFTPYNKKWYYLQDITRGDTLCSYIRRSNIHITEMRAAALPEGYVGRKFFGDGATIRIMRLDTDGHRIEGLDNAQYVMDINLGYYTQTYPLYLKADGFHLEEAGQTRLVVDNVYTSIIDKRGRLIAPARCIDNEERPTMYFFPDTHTLYYNGKFLHLQK